MGQQQLLLLVLTIVIVGLATATALDSFMENRRKAEVDIILNDLVRLSVSSQAWKLKHKAMGGGGELDGFDGVERIFEQTGWETVSMDITASNPDTPGYASRERTECYRSNPSTLYCPVPQWSARRGDGQLLIYVMGSLMTPQGSSVNSRDVEIIATSTVTGVEPGDIMIEVYR
ncbi:MAG: hypothetical protein AAGF99_02925 [Bacteroidota bacterium]